MIRRAARLAILVGGCGLALAAYTTYRIWEQGSRDEQRPAGAVVVLGAAQYNGRPSLVFKARLDHAIALYESGMAPRFVATGGKQPGDRTTEAATARAYAIARGVPADAILVEDSGRTTAESLASVARILKADGIRDAIFVSDPTHMLRVLMIARDDGIEAYGSPTRTSPIGGDPVAVVDATIHELGALANYVAGRLGLPVPR